MENVIKTKRKKLVGILIVSMVCMCFAGCKGNSEEGDSVDLGNQNMEESNDEQAAAENMMAEETNVEDESEDEVTETMASGLTFGIISAGTFGTSVDEIAQNLENGATYLAQQSADYIKKHDKMLDRWESGSELDQVGVFCEALFKMAFSM